MNREERREFETRWSRWEEERREFTRCWGPDRWLTPAVAKASREPFRVTTEPKSPAGRKAIPQAVKIAVAVRDGGQCQCTRANCHGYDKCGSTVEPHYDHIIPWSKGGTDTVGNLQVFCGPCNRRKGADG